MEPGNINHLTIRTNQRMEMIDLTQDLNRSIEAAGQRSGILYVYVPHTTAGLMINESADPAVRRDVLADYQRLLPESQSYYEHMEGNSDSHALVGLVGTSEVLFVENDSIQLGTWQTVYFCEFDGPRNRTIWTRFLG